MSDDIGRSGFRAYLEGRYGDSKNIWVGIITSADAIRELGIDSSWDSIINTPLRSFEERLRLKWPDDYKAILNSPYRNLEVIAATNALIVLYNRLVEHDNLTLETAEAIARVGIDLLD